MVPFIMAALSMAQQKAQNENAQNQQLAQNMQNVVNNNQIPQFQPPTINSVFGNY